MTNADGSALRLAGGDERKRPPMGAAHLGVVHRFLTKPSMDWALLGTPYPPVAMTRSIAPSDCAAALLRFLAISTSWSPMPGGRCDRSFFSASGTASRQASVQRRCSRDAALALAGERGTAARTRRAHGPAWCASCRRGCGIDCRSRAAQPTAPYRRRQERLSGDRRTHHEKRLARKQSAQGRRDRRRAGGSRGCLVAITTGSRHRTGETDGG